MEIIYYHPFFTAQTWLDGMRQRLPQAHIRQWQPGDDKPADYALVWQPPYEMLAQRQGLRAIFALGAGVDAILAQARAHPGSFAGGGAAGAPGGHRHGSADGGVRRRSGDALFPPL